MIKLNLGCGHDRRPGFINIDADRRVKPDIIHDLTQALPVANRSVDLILLQDILEHLTIQEVEILIKNCAQVLKITGQLEIRIPNVYAIGDGGKSLGLWQIQKWSVGRSSVWLYT